MNFSIFKKKKDEKKAEESEKGDEDLRKRVYAINYED